ncbi:unnamed protein product [Anisakis simplex]|uniref:G protein-coupled receptor n=1 Tax=Anisakis simplex TaxID=6269 RepID=A0A0M3K7A6_ANISI|nr:unnamed protein product [Anisakis simplex]
MMAWSSSNSLLEDELDDKSYCDTQMLVLSGIELFTSLTGCLLCVLTIVLLRRFNVFHVNLRKLVANAALIVFFGSVCATIRACIAIHQCLNGFNQVDHSTISSKSDGRDSDDNADKIGECYLRDSISPSIAIALTINGLWIAIERLYATVNFNVYEYQAMGYVLNAICTITVHHLAALLPIILDLFGFSHSLMFSEVGLAFSCPNLNDSDYWKVNIVYLIAAFCETIFIGLYLMVYYELRNLAYPLFSIIFPLSYIYRCPIFYSKARLVAVELLFPRSEGKLFNIELFDLKLEA